MREKPQKLSDRLSVSLISVFASKAFFIGVLLLAAIQGLWYALTIKPGMYDEGTHLGFISMYTHHLSPFIAHQDPRWDFLGETTRSGSYLFYYLMSFPARLVELFTDNRAAMVITLRLIMVATFVLGLYLYRKVLSSVGLSRFITHTALLLLVLIPMIAPEAGVVNYDNVVFLLAALILLLAVQIVKAKRLNVLRLALLLIVGLVGSEIKFEIIALFVPVLFFVVYDQVSTHKHNLKHELRRGVRGLSKPVLIVLATGLLLSVALFVERPGYNFIRYHDISGAPCAQLISRDRCMKNPIVVRNMKTRENKPATFKPINPITYTSSRWAPTMIGTLIIVLARFPVMVVPALFYYVFFYGGVVMILLYLRQYWRSRLNQLLIFALAIYVVGLMLFNYKGYVSSGAAFAMNGRYLLPVLPIFIAFVLVALKNLIAIRFPRTAVASLCLGLLMLFTQGGGIGTAALTIPNTLYWKNPLAHRFNSGFKKVLHPVVFERNPFSEPFQ